MSAVRNCDEELIRNLPLPLAQLYRRAHNAKTPQERHHAAYYLWEAALKLLGSVAIVEYAELGDQDPELITRLQTLARPSVGHWWEFVRRLTPVLAQRDVPGFVPLRDMLLGRARDDLPRAAGLDNVLQQVVAGRAIGGARTTVRLTELFDRLVHYRNKEFGHGAVGQRPAAVYERVGQALLAGVAEVLSRMPILAGRRLLYVAEVRRQSSGSWLVERYELHGEAPRRLESLDLPDGEALRRLLPDRLYLDASPCAPLTRAASAGERRSESVSLHPLVLYEPDGNDVLFLNSRQGRERIDYLSYNTGRETHRADLAQEQRELLTRLLQVSVDASSQERFAAQSQAEVQEPTEVEESPGSRRRLGEFELLSELGRGGMGLVYRAWQPSLGRQVAVKALYRTGDPKAEARFAREIRSLGRVEHPHLVKIFTSGNEGDQWFYAMELVEGAPLSAVCERLEGRSPRPETVDVQIWQEAVSTVCADARKAEKPLDGTPQPQPPPAGPIDPADLPTAVHLGRSYVRQAVELVRQVAEALHALHERNILHRDIKPGNIMVTSDGSQAVLMDLGLAQIADEVEGRLTKTRQFVGTLRYASPEQLLAVGDLDRRSDVYGLGATLWELITLRPMFNATEQTPTPELMRRINVEEPERPRRHHPGLSRDLEAIVLKCLEKVPAQRYATAQQVAEDLERFQRGEPVAARPVGSWKRGWRWCRRKPALAGMLATLGIVIVGSLIGLTALYLDADHHRRVADQLVLEKSALARKAEEARIAAEKSAAEAKRLAVKLAELAHIAEQAREQAERSAFDEMRARQTAEQTAKVREQSALIEKELRTAAEKAVAAERVAREKADRLAAFLMGAIQPDDPIRYTGATFYSRKADPSSFTVKEMLNIELRRAEEELRGSPLAYAAVRDSIGDLCRQLAMFETAEILLNDSLRIRRKLLPADDHDLATSCFHTAWYYQERGDFEKATPLYVEALKIRRKLPGGEALVADTLQNLAWVYFYEDPPREQEMGKCFEEALSIRKKLLEKGSAERRKTLLRDVAFTKLGMAYASAGLQRMLDAKRIARDEQLRAEIIELQGNENLANALTHFIEAGDDRVFRNPEKAVRELEAAYKLIQNTSQVEVVLQVPVTIELIHALSKLERAKDAEKYYRSAVDIARRNHMFEIPKQANFLNVLGGLLRKLGKTAEANALWEEYLAAQKFRFGLQHRFYKDAQSSYQAFARPTTPGQGTAGGQRINK